LVDETQFFWGKCLSGEFMAEGGNRRCSEVAKVEYQLSNGVEFISIGDTQKGGPTLVSPYADVKTLSVSGGRR
jgi:hypothetical protein